MTAHVVMLVANDVSADTRVRKSALAVAALGVQVTVVGIAAGTRREVSRLGPVQILRVPVDFALRDRRRDRRARRHRGEIALLTTDHEAEALARRRLALAQRDAQVRDGVGGTVARAAVDARRLAVRASGRGRREAARAVTLAYKVYDKGLQSVPIGADPQRVVPEIDDLELAVGPVLDELAPDVVHAHDVHFLAVTGRYVARQRAAGRSVPWVYDAHEWVPGLSRYGGRTPRVVAAWAALEKTWAPRADRVITVSPPLAEALKTRHGLSRLPEVVLNVPPLAPERPESESVARGDPSGAERPHARPGQPRATDTASGHSSGVRAAAGVGEATLLVYSGGVQAARGVETAVEALVHLPTAHLAVVAVPSVNTPAVAAVRARAEQLGVAERVHLLDPVRPDQVVDFLRTADVGLIPLRHFGSHEMALANKLFEYLYAGVPMVVSDCRAQAEFVREHGLGEVHVAGDGADLAAAVGRVLARREEIRVAMTDPALLARYTWSAQERALQQLYRELLPDADLPSRVAPSPAAEPPEVPEGQGAAGRTLVIGPANSAGQAWAWTRCAARYLDGVSGWTIALRNERYDYPADELVDRQAYLTDADWQLGALARARSTWTHALLEAGRPLLGGLAGRDFVADADLLRRSGIEVGLVFHGSEVRDPRRHRTRHEFSPFADPRSELTRRLQARHDELAPLVEGFDGPLFASTPDQLDDLPERATWLPVVVDTEVFTPVGCKPPLENSSRPLVVHAPSNPALKGTAFVQRELEPLHDKGLIELRMVTGLPPAEAAELVRTADIVVDQLVLGLYGVLACEAMACGRVVVGYLGDALRARVGATVPVVEATARTVGEVVGEVLDDPDRARAAAESGPAFVAEFHDGRRSASVLAPFLGVARDEEDHG